MSVLLPGFAAAGAAQSCFRAILEAMSRPGRTVCIGTELTPPENIFPAAAAVLLTLVDSSVGVSLPNGAQRAQEWLVFHTGARLAAQAKANFVLAEQRPVLRTLLQGTDDEPETGATLILQVPSLKMGRRVQLKGPGIETATVLDLPLDDAFLKEWRAQRRSSPLGVDLLLCAADRLVALPRSVSIEET